MLSDSHGQWQEVLDALLALRRDDRHLDLNSYNVEHVAFSETRTYMALMMGATMAVIMLSFMGHMLTHRGVNIAILAGSAAVFAAALWLGRSQTTVEDVSYMKAMIPHHSIADEIIEAQRREIAEMQALIAELEAKR